MVIRQAKKPADLETTQPLIVRRAEIEMEKESVSGVGGVMVVLVVEFGCGPAQVLVMLAGFVVLFVMVAVRV